MSRRDFRAPAPASNDATDARGRLSRRDFVSGVGRLVGSAAVAPLLGGASAAAKIGSEPISSGARYVRGEPAYEMQRLGAVWQALKPPRYPDLIVQARSEADVVQVLRYARGRRLPVAVKGGGHSYTATFLRNRGILLDVSSLREISIDDGSAVVRAQPGIRAGELCKLLEARGLAFPLAHSANVPIGGYLLGGGMGWNGESWGRMACLRVRAVDVITAAGERLTVDERSHPDLYWAARGAGPAFCAVATRFHLAAFPYPRGMRAASYTFPIETSPVVTRWLNKLAAQRLANLELTLALETDADGARQCTAAIACFAATEADARATLDTVARSAPSGDAVARSAHRAVTFDDLYEGSRTGLPRRVAVDNAWTNRPFEAVEELVADYRRAPSPHAVAIANFQAGGPLPDAACSVTGTGYLLWMAAWDRAEQDAENFRWVHEAAMNLQRFTTGCYVNEADLEHRPTRVRQCFPAAVRARLRRIASRYDPAGLLPPAFALEPGDEA